MTYFNFSKMFKEPISASVVKIVKKLLLFYNIFVHSVFLRVFKIGHRPLPVFLYKPRNHPSHNKGLNHKPYIFRDDKDICKNVKNKSKFLGYFVVNPTKSRFSIIRYFKTLYSVCLSVYLPLARPDWFLFA